MGLRFLILLLLENSGGGRWRRWLGGDGFGFEFYQFTENFFYIRAQNISRRMSGRGEKKKKVMMAVLLLLLAVVLLLLPPTMRIHQHLLALGLIQK